MIPAGARDLPSGAVPYTCTNETCNETPYWHGACAQKLHDLLLNRAVRSPSAMIVSDM